MPDITTALQRALDRHRAAYIEWRRTTRLTDALHRDSRRSDLRLFGYTDIEIEKIEQEIDQQQFSGS